MSGFSDGWPKWAKPVFALAVAAIWIGMPLVAAWSLSAQTVQAGGIVDYQPVLVVLVGMTTATITGTFVFMTFRIDRGTKKKAGEVAKKAAAKAAKEKLTDAIEAEKKKLDEVVEDAKKAVKDAVSAHNVDEAIETKLDTVASPDKIHQKVAERITEQELRKHVQAVLMVDANAQAIAAFAREQAKSLDQDAILRISKLLKEAADSWAQSAEGEEHRGWRFFGRWGRSRRTG